MENAEVNCWYAIHTKARQEELAAANLRRLGLEVLYPRLLEEKVVWGKVRGSLKPLFPNYLFAKFPPAGYSHLIRYARGVRQIVSCGNLLLPVDEGIINDIRGRLDGAGCARITPEPLYPGEQVVVREGPLEDLTGLFAGHLNDQKRVVILLRAIELKARLLIDRHRVEPVRRFA